MNKKRFISLAMALVMLLGVFAMAMITASADSTFDYRNIASAKNLEKDVNANITPDGEIGNDEYTVIFESVSMKSGDNTERGRVVHYLAHDDNYIYLAIEFVDGITYTKNGQYIHLDVAAFQVFDNAAASYIYASKGGLTFKGVDGQEKLSFPVTQKRNDVGTADVSAFGESGTLDTSCFDSFVKKGDNSTAVAEFKISKAALAEAGGYSSAAAIETFRYTVAFTDWYDSNGDGEKDSSATVRAGATLTPDELTAAIATHADLSGSESFIKNNLCYFAWCIKLDSTPATTKATKPATSATTAAPATSATTAATTAKQTTAKKTTAATTTAAPATTAAETTAATTAAEDKGCGGTLTVSALALLPVIAGGAWIVRKKED